MKIVHYLSRMRLEDGGVVRAVLDLCAALAESGHEVELLTLDASDVPKEWGREHGRPSVFEFTRGKLPLPRLSASSVRQVQQRLRSTDVVHLHVPWDPICVQLAGIARRASVPYVVSIHGMLDDWTIAQRGAKKRLFLALMGRRMLEQAAAVHCTAEAEKDQSHKWYPRGRSEVIPLIFDLGGFMELPGPEPVRRAFGKAFTGDPTILLLSRLHPKKGVELLIEAAARMREAGHAFRVLIAGAGDAAYEAKLRSLVAAKGLSDGVQFLGFVTGREKVSLLQTADVFVLPTSQENWGFALLESMASGTPVITTRGVDIWPELAASGGAAIVEPDPQAIAEAVTALLKDQPRLKAMGIAGREWVLRTLSVSSVVGRYESFYRGLVQ